MSSAMMNRDTHIGGQLSAGWTCSTCGELITGIDKGWVEWLACEDEDGATRLKGMRLVHRPSAGGSERSRCQYHFRHEFQKDQSIVEGLPLERFVGVDGLMLLLSLIAENEMPKAELLELAKRVQIPGYEQSRELFHEAIDGGLVAPLIREGFYMQSEIRELLSWAMYEEQSSSQPRFDT